MAKISIHASHTGDDSKTIQCFYPHNMEICDSFAKKYYEWQNSYSYLINTLFIPGANI